MIGICLGVGAAALFVKHHISETHWLKFIVLFFAFLQIGFTHNGAISFGIGYQYRMFLCFAFLDLYLMFCKTQKKRYYILSSIFWVLAINAYEAFYMFCIMFFLMATLTLWKKKELTLKNLIQYLWLPAILTILSFIYYIMRSKGATYGGNVVDTVYGFADKIKSILIYSFGMFPLNVCTLSLGELWNRITENSYETLFIVIKNVLVAFILCKGVINDKIVSVKRNLASISLAFLGAILCSFLVAITSLFSAWALEAGVKLYGVSYYSYFFIIILMVLVLGGLYKINNLSVQRILKCTVFVVVFVVAIVTELNNIQVSVVADKEDNKYELFDRMVKSDYVSEVQDDNVIYAPEMLGVHHDLSSLDKYFKKIHGKEVSFCNDLSEVDWSKDVFMMHYITDSEVMLFGKVEDEQLKSDEVYAIGLESFSEYSLCASRQDAEYSPVGINGVTVGLYEKSVNIPLDIYSESNEIIVNTSDMPILNTTFVKGNLSDSSILTCEYGEGVSYQELTGRWCATTSSYIINNKEDEVQQGILYLTFLTATGESGDVMVEVNEKFLDYQVGANPTVLEIDVELQKGKNCITVTSQIDSLKTADVRDINLKLTDAYCIVDGIEYSFR